MLAASPFCLSFATAVALKQAIAVMTSFICPVAALQTLPLIVCLSVFAFQGITISSSERCSGCSNDTVTNEADHREREREGQR